MIFLEKLKKITDKVLVVVLILSGFMLLSSVVCYTANCFMRYVVKAPLSWPEEYCTYIVVLMVFLMQCRLEFRDESLSIGVLWEKVKDRPVARRILFSFKGIVTIGVSLILAFIGKDLALQQFMYKAVTPVMRIPFGIYYAAIAICFLLVVLVWLIHLFTVDFDSAERSEADA